MSSNQHPQRNCVSCGRAIDWNANICQYCGHDYRPGAIRPYQAGQPKKSKSGLWIIAILVLIIVVVFVLPMILYIMVLGFGGTQQPHTTPAATYSKTPISNGERVSIVSITRTDVPWSDVTIALNDGFNFAEWRTYTADLQTGMMVTANYSEEYLGSLVVCLLVTDLAGNGYVSGSDYFQVFTYGGDPGFNSGTTYQAYLLYEPTGERIGTGITFVP